MSKYLDNVTADPRLIGISGLLCPFPGNNASARIDMFSSHISQFLIPNEGEHPLIFTGYESVIADYEFNTAHIDQDIEIIEIVPKYFGNSINNASNNIKFNNFITVIYRGLEDNKISYFNLYKYTKCANGYGYENVWKGSGLLYKGSVIPKGTKLYSSTAHDGDEYKIGVNANVAYMTMFETSEDAFVISESFAKKMQTIGIKTISIRVDPDQYPLNIYGTEEEYKIFPDVGEIVRDDNVIMAFRKIRDNNIISDLNDNKIFECEYMYDDCIFAPADSTNAMVIDVDVYLSKKAKYPKTPFSQINKYHEGIMGYYKRIKAIYDKLKNKYQIDYKMNTLVTTAISRLAAYPTGKKSKNKKAILNLVDKDRIINLLKIDITLLYKRSVNNGFKLTGRDGAKGTICSIRKDEDMPVDEEGNVVDMVIDPMAVIRRTNIGQLYEQYINKVLETIRKRLFNVMDEKKAFNMVVEVLGDINPNFADLVKKTYNTKNKQIEYLNHILENGISINIPPFLNTINSDLPIKLKEKWGIKSSRVSFNITDKNGNKKRVTTKEPVDIGKKYIYLLYKIPVSASCGGTFINQYKVPVRPNKLNELKYPVHQTPIKFGEDEFRILNIVIGRAALRLRTLYGTSMKGVTKLIESILTSENPSRLKRVPIDTDELHDDDFIVNIVNNMFRSAAIEMQHVLISPDEIKKKTNTLSFKDLNDLANLFKKEDMRWGV